MKLLGVFSSRARRVEAVTDVTGDAYEKECEEEPKIVSAERRQMDGSLSMETMLSEIDTSDPTLETKEEDACPQIQQEAWQERELPRANEKQHAVSLGSALAETNALPPDIMFPSAEVCQVRSLMSKFDEPVRKRYERVASEDPESGRLLVELLEQFKTLDETALICHGQHENMGFIIGMMREWMNEFCPTGHFFSDQCDGLHQELIIITSTMRQLTDIAWAYSQPGWVYRLSLDSKLHSHLVHLVESIATAFERMGCSKSQSIVLLNTHKAIVSTLKGMHKSGNWAHGLTALRDNPQALESVAAYLKTSPSVIRRESILNVSIPWGLQMIECPDAREEECRAVFHEYCTASPGLSAADFEQYFHDCIDSDKEIDIEDIATKSSKLFVRMDKDFDGFLSLQEFSQVYCEKKVSAAKSLLRLLCGLSMEKKLKKTFELFAAYGCGIPKMTKTEKSALDSARFTKLCRDSNIVSKMKTAEALDIAFTKCVPKMSKKMDFDHFLAALPRISVCSGLAMTEVCKRIAMCTGPTSRCTKASFVKLHDDKTLFTGIYARGGPDVGPVTVDMKAFVGRAKAQASKPVAELTLTLPESPKMATTSRINNSPGPKTPGRGASLEACEARKLREAEEEALKASQGKVSGLNPLPKTAFGRTANKKVPILMRHIN